VLQTGSVEATVPEPFAIEVRRRDAVAVVQPRGELDLATIKTLRDALDGAGSAERLVLDLRGLTYIDSTGLHLLVDLHERARRDGFELVLFAPAAPVDKPIRICGLYAVLPFASDIDVTSDVA
jgi:anti-sigma B factor antagonist